MVGQLCRLPEKAKTSCNVPIMISDNEKQSTIHSDYYDSHQTNLHLNTNHSRNVRSSVK